MENFIDQSEANKHTIRLLLDYIKWGKADGVSLRLNNSQLVHNKTTQNEKRTG